MNQFVISPWQVGYRNKQSWMCTCRPGYQALPIGVRQNSERFYFPTHGCFAGNHWISTAVDATATILQETEREWNCELISSTSESNRVLGNLTLELINFHVLKLKVLCKVGVKNELREFGVTCWLQESGRAPGHTGPVKRNCKPVEFDLPVGRQVKIGHGFL